MQKYDFFTKLIPMYFVFMAIYKKKFATIFFEPFQRGLLLMSRTTESVNEIRLVASISHGDRQAFKTVYDTTYARVHRYIRGFIRDESMVEDIVIQTYTIIWQKADSFKGTSRLTTWIIGIARNVAFSEMRKNKAHVPFDESFLSPDYESHRQPEKRDRKIRLQEMLQNVSAKHREILELVFYQGLTYAEISEMITIPVNTVKTRVFNAKKALKKELRKRNLSANDL